MTTHHSPQSAEPGVHGERGEGAVPENRGPLRLDLARIDEDPSQPRTRNNPGFSRASLEELAVTIRSRGVKTPISVRDNPEAPGRFIVNHGARRFRASRLAGLDAIPAFVDNDYNDVDQVIENLQRDELTAREIAEFIGRELAKGRKKGAIARSIGKSPAFVSQHAVLLDLPDPVALAFNRGRVKDVTLVNDLVKSHRAMPDHVSAWLADPTQDITRGSVKLLREFLSQKRGYDRGNDEGATAPPPDATRESNPIRYPPTRAGVDLPVIRVRHKGRDAQLQLRRKPLVEGRAWIRYADDRVEVEVDLAEASLVALIVAD